MAQITEDYVSCETAELLKEKGFNEATYTYYLPDGSFYLSPIIVDNKNLYTYGYGQVSAPTLQMAMKWLREVHNRYVEICMDKTHNFKDIVFRPAIYDKRLDCLWESDNFPTYEEACEVAIKYCLENLI